jgi:hypothetical protein
MRNRKWYRFLMFAPLGALLLAAFGWLVMSLWNWLMPELFGIRMIGYWQAWGLIILSKILFGGIRGGGGRGGHWRHRMMERVEQMTPEEREKFRQVLQRRWGCMRPVDPGPAQPPAA